MSQKAEIVIEAKDNASKTIKEVSNNIEKQNKALAKSMDDLNKKQLEQNKKLKSSLSTLGTSLAVVGAASIGAMGLAAKSAIEYESAMAGVNKTMQDLSDTQLENLNKKFREMSSVIPESATELAKIAEIGGQLGVGYKDIEKFVQTISKIGVTTNLTSEQAAVAFARISNVMGDSLDDVDRLASSVVDLGNNFAVNEQEIVNFAARLAPIGSAFDMTSAQVLALGAATAASGIRAEAGATAMQTTFLLMQAAASGSAGEVINNTKAIDKSTESLAKNAISMQKNNNRLEELKNSGKEGTATYKNLALTQGELEGKAGELDSTLVGLNATHGKLIPNVNGFAKILGVTNGEFTEMFKKDPASVYVKMVQSMAKAKDEGKNFVAMLEDAGIENARAIMTTLAQVGAVDQLADAMDRSGKAYEDNTALEIEYQKKLATTEAQLEILKNNFNLVAIEIGNALLPAINSLVKIITPMVQKFAEFASKHPQVIVAILGTIAVIGTLSAVIITITPIITALSVVLGAMGITAAVAFAPLTLLIGALVTIPAAIYLAKNETALFNGVMLTLAGSIGRTIPGFSSFAWILEGIGVQATRAAAAERDLKTAQDELAGATRNLEELQLRHRELLFNQTQSTKNYQTAKEGLSEAIKKYGEDSEQAEEAAMNLEGAEIRLEQTNMNVRKSADDLSEAQNKVEESVNNTREAEEEIMEVQADLEASSGGLIKSLDNVREAWSGITGKIGDAISKFREWSGLDGGGGGGSPNLENREHGGIVPGPIGQPVPMIAHGGERITPRTGVDSSGGSSGGGGGISISFNGPVNMDSTQRVDELVSMVEKRLGRQNELARFGVALS